VVRYLSIYTIEENRSDRSEPMSGIVRGVLGTSISFVLCTIFLLLRVRILAKSTTIQTRVPTCIATLGGYPD
jgi:hypothetical protein